jgi:multidrug resistance efflux pump
VRDLQKIPVPWPQRWRAIRFRVLPVLVFGLAATATVVLWNRQFVVTQAIGEVYSRRIDLAVQYDGVLLDAPYQNWRLYDRVAEGEVLARLDDAPTLALIDTVRQELAKAKGELMAAEEDFRTTQDDREFQRSSEARRLAMDVESRYLAVVERKALLAADEMEMRRQDERLAIANAKSTTTQQPLTSRLDAIEIQRLRDVAAERIRGHNEYIAQAEAELKPARARLTEQTPLVRADIERVLNPLRAAIAYEEARIRELELQRKALEIRSPIDGYIVRTTAENSVAAAQSIAAAPGRQVRAGTVLFTVAADEPEYIVSYVRPTQRLRPEVDMRVAIRPRNRNQVAYTRIETVGPQVELVPAHQLRDQKLMEWGLPVRIAVPPALNLQPGEIVDLKFFPASEPPPPDDLVMTRG